MIRIEIDENSQTGVQLLALCGRTQASQRAALARFNEVPKNVTEFEGMGKPIVETDEEILLRTLTVAAREKLAENRFPSSVVTTREPKRLFKKGERTMLEVSVPIGAEILALEASASDGRNWIVHSLCFGTMPLISPHSTGAVPLSNVLYITNKDLLHVFDGCRTTVDVRFSAQLECLADEATFDGFKLYINHVEHVFQIGTRLQKIDVEEERKIHERAIGPRAMLNPHQR
jgi:hypothetical protein